MTTKKIKDFSVSKEMFDVVYDSEKDGYATQMPHLETLNSYYASEDYISHTDGKRNLLEKIYQKVKSITLRQKWKLLHQWKKNTITTVLDIGCGTGDFLKYGSTHFNIQTQGVEPHPEARKLAQSKKLNIVSDLNEVPKKNYDIITLWHVLEHVPDLSVYYQFFKDRLANDGLLIIALPNHKSYDATYYKNYWAAWDVPRHLWHFSKKMITEEVKAYGFELIHIEPMYFDSFYVSLLSEKYKTGRYQFLKAAFIGLRSNWKAKRSKEYSSHIYIFKKSA